MTQDGDITKDYKRIVKKGKRKYKEILLEK